MPARFLAIGLCAALGQIAPPAPTTDARIHVLPNGLTSIVQPRRGPSLVAIDVWVKAGSAHERDDERGSAHFLEHMLFRGTQRRPGGQADFEIESMGGLLNAGTTRNGAHIFATVPSASTNEALEIIADVLRNPALNSTLMETERRVILDESAGRRNEPMRRSAEALLAAAFPGDNLGRPILGAPDDIARLKLDALTAFHRRRYLPCNTIAVLVGDVTTGSGHRMVERAFADWSSQAAATSTDDGVLAARTIGPLRVSSATETVEGIVWSVPHAGGQRGRAELELIAEMLSMEWSRTSSGRPPLADVVPCPGGYLLRAWWPSSEPSGGIAVRRRADALGATGPTSSELDTARRRVLGRLLFETETVAGLARSIGELAICEGPGRALDFQMRLTGCTRAQIQALARQWLAPDGRAPRP